MGFDSSPTLIDDLKAGVIDALVVQDPFNIGFVGVRTIVQKLRGETPPKKIDLPARLITAADLDKPDVQQLLHPDLDKYLQ